MARSVKGKEMVSRKEVLKKQVAVKRAALKRPPARATRLHPAPLQQATALSEKLRQQAAVLEQAHLDAKRHADAAASVTAALLDQRLSECEKGAAAQQQAVTDPERVAQIAALQNVAPGAVPEIAVNWPEAVAPEPVHLWRRFWNGFLGR